MCLHMSCCVQKTTSVISEHMTISAIFNDPHLGQQCDSDRHLRVLMEERCGCLHSLLVLCSDSFGMLCELCYAYHFRPSDAMFGYIRKWDRTVILCSSDCSSYDSCFYGRGGVGEFLL